MSSKRDYIPANDKKFNSWFKNLSQIVVQKTSGSTPAWTHIPASEVTLLTTAYADWYTAYGPTENIHTTVETLVKDEARAAAEKIIRPFVGQWLMWKQVTDAEREAAGLHNPKPRRKKIPRPPTVPELSARAGHPRQVLVFYRDLGAEHWGKPEDVHGLELRWAFLDHPPVNIEKELTNSAFDTRSPLEIVTGEEDRGKRIYMAGRWEIEREGIKGDFGEVVSAIVP
jgi:hypothetical protein